ncbi:MAG TPA: VWA domain-containing protein [Burkholderiaceae bacterium]|nr:VWA domain-containing protein [Burkholderiaceae bacterium]
MSVALEDYGELAEQLGAHAQEVLHACWNEAARTFTAASLESVYLKGARALHLLGRGNDLVVTFLQEAPAVAREVGEEAVSDLVEMALRCVSKTSATVVTAIIGSSPVAARRLAERRLFDGYLRLLENLLAQVPRGVRPMLGQLDILLGQLTLGGLRRWANWGAQAHRTDFDAQVRYFGLESPEALAVLQQERKGTLFVDVQRRLAMYLRALWGRDFFLRPTSGDYESREGYRPYIERHLIYVPDAYDDTAGVSGLELYRAAVAHAAAHLAYTRSAISAEALNPVQMALVALIEDARVEALALREFPGLRPIWARLHRTSPQADGSCADHMSRLARALLDPAYVDEGPLVVQGRALFAQAQHELTDNRISWEIGTELANLLMHIAPPFQPRTDFVQAPYRDDNRYVWEFDELVDLEGVQTLPWFERQVRRNVSLMEFINETDVETAGDDAQEIWVLSSELFPYEDRGISYNQMEGKEPAPDPHHYPEWDYQIQVERPHWVTVLEQRAPAGEVATIDAVVARYKPIVGRLKRLIEALQPQGVQRLRRLEEGDEIDLNAAINALIQIRKHDQPDTRIMMRNVRRQRDLAVLLLIDLSQSTSDKVRGSEQTVLELARDACALLADAMQKIGDPFAIHGFSSDGRHEVRYTRFKDFELPYDAHAKSRLAAMSSGMSTRMGAAMRHAGAILQRCPQSRKLLLVLTDGEPADIDVRDPQYLRHDARKAVEALGRCGITSYCLSLDPHADQYVARIFGARNYRVLDRVERLPEQLPALYVGLTGR